MAAGQSGPRMPMLFALAAVMAGGEGVGPVTRKFGSGTLRMSAVNAPKRQSQAKRRKLRRGKR